MKKIVTIIAACLSSLPIFADIYFPHRFFEMGIDASGGAGQNLVGVSDIFQKEVVIDFPKIYKGMNGAGFVVEANEKIDFHTDLIIAGWGAGFRMGESLNARIGVSKDFFKLLAYGNELDTEVETTLSADLSFFVETSATVYMSLGKLKVRATPTYFVPIVYLPNPNVSLKYITGSDGKVSVRGDAGFSVYTAMNMSSCFKESIDDGGNPVSTFDVFSVGSIFSNPDLIKDCAGCGGFDIAAQVEFPLSEKLDLGFYANIPIVPGRLNNGVKGSADFSFDMEGFLTHFTTQDPEGEAFTMDYHISDVEAIDTTFTVNRPMRAGVECAFRPLPFIILHPKVGVAMKNPFGKDFQLSSIYPEYSLDAVIHLFNILGLNITTQYTDKIFAHSLGLYLNARVLELTASIGTSSGDFLKSFAIGGLSANIGISIGF